MVSNYNEALHKKETLETERLLLRKLRDKDAADVFEWERDAETVK